MVSILCLSVDALIARNQAVDIVRTGSYSADRQPKLALKPFIAPAVSPEGVVSTMLGLNGIF
jgi:hypothetical protein